MQLEELINQHYSKLNDNDFHILKYILNHKEHVLSSWNRCPCESMQRIAFLDFASCPKARFQRLQ